MAYLNPTDVFVAEDIDLAVVGIASDLVSHDSGFHQHRHHIQLLYAPSGCMTLIGADTQVILPPSHLLLIPQGMAHRVTFRNVVSYRSIYLRAADFKSFSSRLIVLSVNPLLRELIERICFWDWKVFTAERCRLLSVFLDELQQANVESLHLRLPVDIRLSKKIESYIMQRELPPFLKALAKEVGASEKTISRIFKRETGMSYQNWRMQWRLFRAIELLAEKKTISEVTDELLFSSDSAFIDFFKKHTGITPNRYF